MTDQERKELAKLIIEGGKVLEEILNKMNKDIQTCAGSLKNLSNANQYQYSVGDYWRPVFGPGEEVPGDEYDWVLVEIRWIGSFQPGGNNILYPPRIARYNKEEGLWYPIDYGLPYGHESNPFEVLYWRPLPEGTAPGQFPTEIMKNSGGITDNGR